MPKSKTSGPLEMEMILSGSSSYKEFCASVNDHLKDHAFTLESWGAVARSHRGWLVSWVYSGAHPDDLIRALSYPRSRTFLQAPSFEPMMHSWASKRSESSLRLARRLWDEVPAIRYKLAGESPHEEIQELSLELIEDKNALMALSNNKHLNQEVAVKLTFCYDPPYPSTRFQDLANMDMSYQFLRNHELLAPFTRELNRADQAALMALHEGWVGSLRELLFTCEQFAAE